MENQNNYYNNPKFFIGKLNYLIIYTLTTFPFLFDFFCFTSQKPLLLFCDRFQSSILPITSSSSSDEESVLLYKISSISTLFFTIEKLVFTGNSSELFIYDNVGDFNDLSNLFQFVGPTMGDVPLTFEWFVGGS